MFDRYIAEEKTIGRYLVRVIGDSDYSLSDAVNDEPVLIFGRDRWRDYEILDQSKRNFPSMEFMRHFEDGDISDCLGDLCDMSYSDWQWQNGRVRVEHGDWSRPRYFKTEQTALTALFLAEHGAALSDLRVEQFGDNRSTYYLCFWQSELDSYAGGKGCKSCCESCQNIVDGEVWGFDIVDSDGESLDSCWGFIGDSSYCLSEGIAAAEYLEKEAKERDAVAMAQSIAESRPDMVESV